MTSTSDFDRFMDAVSAGERLASADLAELAAAPDIIPLGMLADAVRRRLHGTQVTYLRVAAASVGEAFSTIPAAAREVRISGTPASLDAAFDAVARARHAAGDRTVSAFSWPDLEALAVREGVSIASALDELRTRGLDAVAEVPLDCLTDPEAVVERLAAAGCQVRLTIEQAAAKERVALLLAAADLQDRHARIRSLNPLPTIMNPSAPTTGYEDVKMVAVARLAAPNVPTIQVDWLRYGPKLAQVALTFGADDLDNVSASDEAPDGRRRAPLEEVRRNIEAAGFEPAERDGRFSLVT